jgi:UDP-N-acetylglucosamine--N-acetylmuramyl-(pentapeptide) pyrophosphoryl-undecaprenol N-acetylglucosamine transferase
MFPAVALARELVRRGHPVVLACDQRGARYLPADLESTRIASASPSGSATRKLLALVALARGLIQSLGLLIRRRPGAVAALGGYASAPVAIAARLLGTPVVVHEQNAVLGRANRMMAKRAARIALTFAATRGAEKLPEDRILVTGNPVRAEFGSLAGRGYRPPAAGAPLRLIVVGGSQGARILSEVVPAGIGLLTDAQRARVQLTQQCRPEDLDRVQATYRNLGFEAELRPFFDDLPARLADAHLVVSRSGASSVAEILALGRPALLVPYRHAADDHQRANADVLADAGAAWVVPETELTSESVRDHLAGALGSPDRLAQMAAAARALARPDAAARLADALLGVAGPVPAEEVLA